MGRKNLNVDVRIGGRKCNVRKRGCSSSSSSSLAQNCKLKRAFLVGKRVGSSTPVPFWKMKGSKSPSVESDKAFKFVAAKGGEKTKELSVSARKLAATFWEINGLPSPKVKSETLEDRVSEVGNVRKERLLEPSRLSSMAFSSSDPFHVPVYERTDSSKAQGHRRRTSTGSQKFLLADSNLGGGKSPCNRLVEFDPKGGYSGSSVMNPAGSRTHLKDMHNGLTTCRELLKLIGRIWRFEHKNSTSLSLLSAIKFELDRTCIHFNKFIVEGRTKQIEASSVLKQAVEENVVQRINELEMEKKLRKQTERLNKKLGKELAESKATLLRADKELEGEKRAREILEQVCEELARGIGEDKAEVEEIKRQSAKVREEVEKEREMLQLADVLREERVKMKLYEAKYQFEEKNAVVDQLRNELEAFLKLRMVKEQEGGVSPSYDKIKALEKYLRETLPGSYHGQDQDREGKEDDSDESDLHSIELNMDDTNKSFRWNDAFRSEPKGNSVDKTKGRKSISEKIKKPIVSAESESANGIQWDFMTDKQERLACNGLFEFSSETWKKGSEEEIERYNVIKSLRDNIVASSRKTSSEDSASSGQNMKQQSGVLSNAEEGRIPCA